MQNDIWITANFTSAIGNRYIYASDGNITGAVYMIDSAYQNGIRLLYITPVFDYCDGIYENLQRIERTRKLCTIAAEKYPGLKLCSAMRIKYFEGTYEYIINGTIKGINNGKYLLIIFDCDADFKFIKRAVRNCFMMGFRPILCNIMECNNIRTAESLDELVEEGAYISIKADYITEHKNKRIVKEIFERKLVSFIHDEDRKNMGAELINALKIISKKYGSEMASRISYDNYIKVYQNEKLD